MSDTNTPRTWDDYLDAVDAELTPANPELTEEEQRYQDRKETNDIANNLTIPTMSSGIARKQVRPDPLGPDATAADIAARLRV